MFHIFHLICKELLEINENMSTSPKKNIEGNVQFTLISYLKVEYSIELKLSSNFFSDKAKL